MKWLLTGIITICSSFFSYAQNDSLIETMMTKRVLLCPDVTLNATTVLPQLYKDGQVQLITDLLLYWHRKCGDNAALYTFKTLYDIEHNTFREDFLLFRFLKHYQHHIEAASLQDDYRTMFYNQTVDQGYYPFIKEWSEKLLATPVRYSAVERFVLEFYAHPSDSLLERLENKEFKGSLLQQDQKAYHRFDKKHGKNGLGISLTGGTWLPTQQLAKIGVKGTLGFQFLYAFSKTKIFVEVLARFQGTGQGVYIKDDDSLFYVKKQSGVYGGVGCSYECFKKERHALEAMAGIGYDALSFVLIEGKRNEKDYTKDRGSLNVNLGMGYRYYFQKNTPFGYIGLDARYNYTHYRNNGGTALTGNAVTIGLNIGISAR